MNRHKIESFGQKTHRPRNMMSKCFVLFIMSLFIVQLFVSNRLATIGLTVSQLENDISNLSSQNASLREEIATYSALTSLRQRAQQMGFTTIVTPRFVANEPDVAIDLH